MIDFDRIVAYGCSFTSGEELIDHLVIDSLSEEQVDDIKREYTVYRQPDFFKKYHTREFCTNSKWYINDMEPKPCLGLIREEQVKYAWPRWLADTYGVSWLNRGWGGSSLEYAIYLLEQDLHNNIINENDLIIVAVTTPNREMWFDNYGNPMNPVYGFHNGQWWTYPNTDEYNNYILTRGNSYNVFWNYYRNLRYLDLLSQKLNGKLLVFNISCAPDRLKEFYYTTDISGSVIDCFIDDAIEFKSRIKDAPFFTFDGTREQRKDYCGWRHPKFEMHQSLALNLASAIEQHYAT